MARTGRGGERPHCAEIRHLRAANSAASRTMPRADGTITLPPPVPTRKSAARRRTRCSTRRKWRGWRSFSRNPASSRAGAARSCRCACKASGCAKPCRRRKPGRMRPCPRLEVDGTERCRAWRLHRTPPQAARHALRGQRQGHAGHPWPYFPGHLNSRDSADRERSRGMLSTDQEAPPRTQCRAGPRGRLWAMSPQAGRPPS